MYKCIVCDEQLAGEGYLERIGGITVSFCSKHAHNVKDGSASCIHMHWSGSN